MISYDMVLASDWTRNSRLIGLISYTGSVC
jgi:hypothetical protein